MKILTNILYSLFFILLIGGAALFVLPSMPFLGHLDVKIVKSGSMEPGIKTGGIVVVQAKPVYGVGDVITFTSTGADIPTTHRIVGTEVVEGETLFVTKGDANEERDTELIAAHAIRGTVLFTLPYVGFILDFARQPLGFALLIGLPALLIVIDEIEKIWREIRKRKRESVVATRAPEVVVPAPLVVAPYVPPRVRMMDIRRVSPPPQVEKPKAPARVVERRGYHDMRRPGWVMATSLSLMFVVLMGSAFSVGGTASYFNDTESTLGNTMEANALGFTLSPSTETVVFTDTDLNTPESTLTTTVTLEAGSVPLVYQLTAGNATGTLALCDAVTVSSPNITYSGSIAALFENVVSLGSSWDLAFNLGAGAYAPGDMCTIDLIHGAWNAALPIPSGYDDEEIVRLTFTAPAAPIAPLVAPASFMLESVDMGTSDMVPPEGDVPPLIPPGEEIVPPSEEVPVPPESVIPEVPTELVVPEVPPEEVIEEPLPEAPVPVEEGIV